MSKKKRAVRKPTIGQIAVMVVVVGAVIVGGLALWRPFSNTRTGLRDSDTAFSLPARVGQPAPKFTAINVDGQPYTITPSDGRPKAIVFYMGFQ